MVKTVYANAIEEQIPSKANVCPLTLGSEIKQLKEVFTNIETNIPFEDSPDIKKIN